MTRNVNLAIGLALLAGQVFVSPDLIPNPLALKWAHAVLAFLQVIQVWIAHNFNPDGTTAKVAYDPRTATDKIIDEALKK